MKIEQIKEIIKQNLDNVLESAYIPELGEQKKGKVRDIYFTKDGNVIMIASDRVSAFDHVLSRCIPFKGAVLNGLSGNAMRVAEENEIQTAMVDFPDANVIVQKRHKNTGIECVVRGYMWGSMANAYERGERNFCGIKLPEHLHRYQKLDEILFTPTTKAEKGHDENISFEQMSEMVGGDTAERIRESSIRLFNIYSKSAEEKGLILIDTKYEFGTDEQRKIYLIDEATTPDSSRFCEAKEWEEKFPQINVSYLTKEDFGLKIAELSKQFVRDVLIEAGYKEGGSMPELTDEQVIETSLRYIQLYERFTGKPFDFENAQHTRRRIIDNLSDKGYIKGGIVALMLASKADEEHAGKLIKALNDNEVPHTGPFFASAHKETRKVLDYLDHLNTSIEPVVIIASAGRSNGLGPVIAGNTNFPVIACNPYKDAATYEVDIHSSIRMPGKLPLAVIVEPENAVLYAKRILEVRK